MARFKPVLSIPFLSPGRDALLMITYVTFGV